MSGFSTLISDIAHEGLIGPTPNQIFFSFFFTKQALPSLLLILVTFGEIALCYNGLLHITLKFRWKEIIYKIKLIKLDTLIIVDTYAFFLFIIYI